MRQRNSDRAHTLVHKCFGIVTWHMTNLRLLGFGCRFRRLLWNLWSRRCSWSWHLMGCRRSWWQSRCRRRIKRTPGWRGVSRYTDWMLFVCLECIMENFSLIRIPEERKLKLLSPAWCRGSPCRLCRLSRHCRAKWRSHASQNMQGIVMILVSRGCRWWLRWFPSSCWLLLLLRLRWRLCRWGR